MWLSVMACFSVTAAERLAQRRFKRTLYLRYRAALEG